MPQNDAMSDLLERLRRNAGPLRQNYNSANDLLGAAVGEAFPWVLGLPVVRGKIPAMFRNALPKGSPVTLDKLERLTTQLVAILAASYGSPGPNTTPAVGGGQAPRPQAQATIHNFKER